MDLFFYFIVLVLLIILSAFFSGSELALFSVSRIDLTLMVEEKVKGSDKLHRLKENPNKLLVTILLGNNLVNILASSIATMIAMDIFNSAGVGIATGVMTFFILVFGEIIPKSLAVKHSKDISLKIAEIFLFLEFILSPVIYFLESLTNIVNNFSGSSNVSSVKSLLSEEKIKQLVTISAKEGSIDEDECDMIKNVFRLDDIVVDSVMIPSSKVEALDIDISVDNLLDVISDGDMPYTRIPVHNGSKDVIIGVLYVKDLLKYLGKNLDDLKVRKIMRKAFKIRSHMKADDLLDEFMRRRVHMAIVVDDHEKFIGIVTMEDLLEELVGDIMDESDVIRAKNL
ncbi:MAG: HlyC/CorC family transporter [Candidatus Aenigmarchaeota archaeon]|nr:HlyC/CorC family transporter [Candidatus Aenigmarchaeota archaeon]